MANGITMLPVLLGIGFAAVFLGPLQSSDHTGRHRLFSKSDWAAIASVIFIVLGAIPSWLSPVATWRAQVSSDIEPANSLWYSDNTTNLPLDVSPRCVYFLRRDLRDGMIAGSSLLGWKVADAPTHAPTLEGQ